MSVTTLMKRILGTQLALLVTILLLPLLLSLRIMEELLGDVIIGSDERRDTLESVSSFCSYSASELSDCPCQEECPKEDQEEADAKAEYPATAACDDNDIEPLAGYDSCLCMVPSYEDRERLEELLEAVRSFHVAELKEVQGHIIMSATAKPKAKDHATSTAQTDFVPMWAIHGPPPSESVEIGQSIEAPEVAVAPATPAPVGKWKKRRHRIGRFCSTFLCCGRPAVDD